MSNKALDILLDSLAAGRLHHAVLLYGASHRALEEVAKAVAEKIFGRSADSHPDLFELRPEGKARQIKIGSKGDRTDGSWPANTMRKLISDIRQTSNAGFGKVAIVYEADRMNDATANAFLKTLEEPPDDTHIFILTTRPNDLLDTIRSRCIALRVSSDGESVRDEQWLKWLEDFKLWQEKIMGGVGRKNLADTMMACYGLLARFSAILTRMGDELSDLGAGDEAADEEVLEAERAGMRRAIRKRMLGEIEDACVSCALKKGEFSAIKLSRAVAALEKSSGFMELNMPDSPALEFFMLSQLRIWGK